MYFEKKLTKIDNQLLSTNKIPILSFLLKL